MKLPNRDVGNRAQLCIFYAPKTSPNYQNERQQTPQYHKQTVIAVAIQPRY